MSESTRFILSQVNNLFQALQHYGSLLQTTQASYKGLSKYQHEQNTHGSRWYDIIMILVILYMYTQTRSFIYLHKNVTRSQFLC